MPPIYRTNQITLISGVPASGKTFFGNWLHKNKGYLHIDMETFQGSEAHRIWEASLQSKNLKQFCDYLREQGPNVVLTWGFHLSDFHLVQVLRDVGVIPWWFRAHHDWARQVYIRRGEGTIQAFDQQFEAIAAHHEKLHEFYGSAIVETLVGPDDYIRPEALYETLFRTT